MAALFVAALAVRMILIAILIFLMFGFCLFRYVLRAYKETNRVESVTKSPTLSFLQETQSGSTVIRAFKREKEFIEHNNFLVNRNTLANQVSMGVWTWYSIRMDILSSFVLMVACGFCVYLRTDTDPVLLTLML